MGVHWKIRFLKDGVYKKLIYRGELCKTGGLGQFADLMGDLARKREGVFLRGELIPQCTLWIIDGPKLISFVNWVFGLAIKLLTTHC